MKRLLVSALFAFVSVFVIASPAMAQATRTWVSGVGDDANPCSRTAPCKTFAGAISKTSVAGEINVLDPGGFGTLTITKSITVDGSGGSIAGVLAAGTNGFNINAPGATVILKNLDINGVAGSGTSGLIGVNVINVGNLIIEDSHIYGFANNGIFANIASSASINIRNTRIDAIASTASAVVVGTSSGTVSASLQNVQISSSTASGLVVKAGGVASIDGSTLSGLGGAALRCDGGSLTASHNVVSNNAVGVLLITGSLNLISNDLFNNSTAISGAGFGTTGDNRVTSAGSSTITNL